MEPLLRYKAGTVPEQVLRTQTVILQEREAWAG